MKEFHFNLCAANKQKHTTKWVHLHDHKNLILLFSWVGLWSYKNTVMPRPLSQQLSSYEIRTPKIFPVIFWWLCARVAITLMYLFFYVCAKTMVSLGVTQSLCEHRIKDFCHCWHVCSERNPINGLKDVNRGLWNIRILKYFLTHPIWLLQWSDYSQWLDSKDMPKI